ncbi:hypothetical protein RND71_008276 [Anisodus tanguticus]|uniref:Uncharacterized protein n=1 Tax=Anisodus tanguticus TaxID=243964 RepID=A0AAE1VKV8_9SOLA|nr:hypothetical protein RND71_008276 [Anisodus tanguticus]
MRIVSQNSYEYCMDNLAFKGDWDFEQLLHTKKRVRLLFIPLETQHLDDKHLSRFLEADGIVGGVNPNDSKNFSGVPK